MDNPDAQPRRRDSSSSIRRFTLNGPSFDFDPRFNAYRADLADVDLASKLFAPHYAEAVRRRCGPRQCDLLSNPTKSAEITGHLQPGEEFDLLDITAGWAWGYRSSDHLVGYLPASSLADLD